MPFAAVDVVSSLQEGLDDFIGFLPRLLGFLAILLIGWLVARVVKGILTKVLQRLGLDKALHSGQTGRYVERFAPGASPSALIGSVAFWAIFIGAFSIAVSALGITALDNFLASLWAYLPNVIAAILIFVLAGAIAAAVGGFVARVMGDTPTGKVVGTAVPALVMTIAIFMILNQLRIAPEIVTITYAAVIGAVALGAALAFGLGGRGVAGRMLEDAYDKGREQKDTVKRDARLARERGQRDADAAKQGAQRRAAPDTAASPTTGSGPANPTPPRSA